MPLDGVVTKNITEELCSLLSGGRIEKVFQPEKDEIAINIRSLGRNYRLLMSASSNFPRVHLTAGTKENPSAPPMFCMLLRKHLTGGKILNTVFHDYERVVEFVIESMDELGDMTPKRLLIEIMGRHSNIIFVNQDGKIIDSIKHVDEEISSVRQVLPGKPYFPPPPQDKISPARLDIPDFFTRLASEKGELTVEKLLLQSIKGFSPLLCREVCVRAGVEAGMRYVNLPSETKVLLRSALEEMIKDIADSRFRPCVIYDALGKPVEFHSLDIRQYSGMKVEHYNMVNEAIDIFFSAKDHTDRLAQKKSDLVKIVSTHLDRSEKKMALQKEKLQEVESRDKLQLYGELLTANIYCLKQGMSEANVVNYYSENGETISIPLDVQLTPQENAQRYFKQYAKAKNAYSAVTEQLENTLKDIEYLESVLQSLDSCTSVREIDEIREELAKQGIVSPGKNSRNKKMEKPSIPLHYISSDGLDILVGKNNRQNDTLTMKTAASNDIWLHTRNIPGSHTIIRTGGKPVPDRTLLDGALLAAFHSKAKMSSLVPVDYTTVKNVKKTPGAKPGMVIYENFKTIIVTPSEEEVIKLKKPEQT